MCSPDCVCLSFGSTVNSLPSALGTTLPLAQTVLAYGSSHAGQVAAHLRSQLQQEQQLGLTVA